MADTKNIIRVFALTNSGWTAITAPAACNYFDIIGTVDGSAMLRSSDPTNASAQYTIPANGWYSMVATVHSRDAASGRFATGETVTYLQATVASVNVVVEFVQ
jgi:hypothetical protein